MICLLPRYVTAKDMTHNVVYVSRTYYEQDKRRDAFVCGPFNWLSELRPNPSKPLLVKVRHGPNMYRCQLQLGDQEHVMAYTTSSVAAGNGMHSSYRDAAGASTAAEVQVLRESSVYGGGSYGLVVLAENDQGLAAGQYAVFYQNGVCLGSAQMLGTVAR